MWRTREAAFGEVAEHLVRREASPPAPALGPERVEPVFESAERLGIRDGPQGADAAVAAAWSSAFSIWGSRTSFR